MQGLRLGPYQLANPWILAPMAGVSEMPFRALARRMGAGAAPTELVSAKGLVYGQAASERYLAHDPTESPFWVQLFGGEPDAMAEGARRAVDLGAQILDINMGCPVRKVTRNGAGSALLADPPRAVAVVAAVRAAVIGVPVTVKIRAGWDRQSINAVEMCERLGDAGVCAVAIHARTRADGFSGKADWSLISRAVESSPVPIIGNGDVRSPEDARRLLETTGCAAVMIGRAALGNPWIFAALSRNAGAPSAPEMLGVVLEHFDAHLRFVGDEVRAVKTFRPHLMWYSAGLAGASMFRRKVTLISDAHALKGACEQFFAARNERRAPSEEFARELVGAALG